MSTLPQPGQTIRIAPGKADDFGCSDFKALWRDGQRVFTVTSLNKHGTPVFEGPGCPIINQARYTNGDIGWEVVDPLAADIETFATPPHHRDQYPRLAAGAVFTNPDGGTEIMIHMKTSAVRQVQLGSLFIEPGDTTAWPVIRGTGRTEKPEPTATATRDTGSHYRREYRGMKLDPYRIAAIYAMQGGPREQIMKKCLRFTDKGQTEHQVVAEIRTALARWEEMLEEDTP